MQIDKKSGVVYRKWLTDSPRAVLLLVHGLGAHSNRWHYLAEFFIKNNISSYAPDLAGFGATEGLKGDVGSFDSYFGGIRDLYFLIKRENPGKKVFLVGESMGALISFPMAAREPGLFAGLICISPAFSSRIKFSLGKKLAIMISLLFNPGRQFEVAFNSEMITRDKNCCAALDADAAEHRLATARLLFNIAIAQKKARALEDMFIIPVLFLLAGEDKLVDPNVAKKVFVNLRARDKLMIQYPGMYHALSIELGREQVFEDILKWIEKRI